MRWPEPSPKAFAAAPAAPSLSASPESRPAGPTAPRGRDANKPLGLIYIALTDGEDTHVKEITIPGDRDRVRLWATQHALEMLRQHLQ